MTTRTDRSKAPGKVPGGVFCVGLLMAAAAGPTTVVGDPRPVAIPDALRAHVPMVELSGLTWAPTLDRYLAVVDDSVDAAENQRHAPFVLGLDRAGRLDVDLIPIDGVDAIDDAEALTAGPDNTFFLLTSHSPNHRGKVKKARRQLLHLKLEGRRLRVTGALDLKRGQDDISRQLGKLGLPEETPIDLEGLAFHDGALYVGLKAPLRGDEWAMIFRLDRPIDALEKGEVAANSLSLWAELKLSVPSATSAMVSQGIADLFFGADGTLYLCANSPKGKPEDGGGALWQVANPRGGRMEGKLLRRFPGLKPEGVAAEPKGNVLTVVFDRNRRDPLWTTYPLPAGHRAQTSSP